MKNIILTVALTWLATWFSSHAGERTMETHMAWGAGICTGLLVAMSFMQVKKVQWWHKADDAEISRQFE